MQALNQSITVFPATPVNSFGPEEAAHHGKSLALASVRMDGRVWTSWVWSCDSSSFLYILRNFTHEILYELWRVCDYTWRLFNHDLTSTDVTFSDNTFNTPTAEFHARIFSVIAYWKPLVLELPLVSIAAPINVAMSWQWKGNYGFCGNEMCRGRNCGKNKWRGMETSELDQWRYQEMFRML